jgi:peroxiredoxin Q/BCP
MARTKARAGAGSGLGPGDAAPDFRLATDDGREVSLADFRGKKVVLYFYPKDDTPGCTKEACSFRDNIARIAAKGAVVLGVSVDSAASHGKFKEKYRLNFPLLADTERRVVEAYGVWQKKALYGRTFLGIQRSTFVIDETGRIAKVFPKVKVDGHVDEVLAAL